MPLQVSGTGQLALSDCRLRDNTADYGGALYVEASLLDLQLRVLPTIIITRATFERNKSTRRQGGGISVQRRSIVITDSEFKLNSAAADGGGIFVKDQVGGCRYMPCMCDY